MIKAMIAGFQVVFNNKSRRLGNHCTDYLSNSEKVDVEITVTSSEIITERLAAAGVYRDGYLEVICAYRKLAEWLPLQGAILLHSAVFDIDGTGVAFAARSGTGKTTQMLLWKKMLGDQLTIVNGDKPIVRFFDDTPYAYGTPWCGKEGLGENTRTHLKHICFIERNEKNFIERLDKPDVINYIFNQVYMPKESIAAANAMQLIDKLLSSCQLWKIHCNMEPQAAEIAYRTIFDKEIIDV